MICSRKVCLSVLTLCATLLGLEWVAAIQGNTVAYAQSASIHSVNGGRVRVQRKDRPDWIPARLGMELSQGDRIFPDRGVRVRVRCPGVRQLSVVKAGVPSGLGSICTQWARRLDRGSQAEETLGGVDTTTPYLISPRHTLLLTSTPTLSWNPVPGTTEYTVEVTGPDGVVWKTQTKQSQIVYAGKPLQPGVPYSVTIRTNTGKSSQDDRLPNQEQSAANLDFRILRPAEAERVRAEASNISPATPTNEADGLDLARFYGNFVLPESVISAYGLPVDRYQTYSLTGDAISLLQSFLRQGKESPLLHRTLADLYWQTGLITPAQTHYLKAIDQVQGLEDLEDWTLAHHSLGKVYAAIGDTQKTVQHYRQARAGYIFLGDTGAATDLTRRIKRLEATSSSTSVIR